MQLLSGARSYEAAGGQGGRPRATRWNATRKTPVGVSDSSVPVAAAAGWTGGLVSIGNTRTCGTGGLN